MASGKTVRFLLPPKTFPMSTPRRRVPEHCKCRFKCPTCEAVFSHYILLCVHTWSHAPGDLRVPDPAVKPCSILQSTENFGLQCFLCPLRFASHLALRQHLDASHTAAEDVKLLRFACAFCAMRYASADLLIAHIQQHDVWEDGDFYPLFAGVVGKPLCERDDTVTSFELDDLVKELQKIAGELPAQKQPMRKSALSIKSRASMHTPLNYLCALCGMKFQHGYQIDEHVRMRHKGFLKLMKARHACVYCGTKFFKLSVLREHLLMHHAISVTPRKKNLVRV